MTIKAAIVQSAAAAGTPTFTQDFTDANAGFSSDVRAAIFFSTVATANDTTTANGQIQIGFAGRVSGQAAISQFMDDGVTQPQAAQNTHSTQAYRYTDVSYVSTGEFAINSWLATGIRVDWTDQSHSELINCLLLGGDIEASVVTATFTNAAAPDTQTLAHGLGGAPEVIIAMSAWCTGDNGAGSSNRASLGFWTGGAYSTIAMQALDAGTVQNDAACMNLFSSGIAGYVTGVSNSTIARTITISSVDATNVNVATDVATNHQFYFLCLRGTSTAIVANIGTYSTPTGTGTAVATSGMSAAPVALLSIPTRMTAAGGSTSDAAGVWGLGAAVNNAGAGSQYGVAVRSTDDAAATTVNKSQTSSTQALRILDVTGAADVEAAISSWDSGGVTLNYSNVNASAFVVPYLAIGQAAVGGSTQWFQYGWPHQRHARL